MILITGATGFVGQRLVARLAGAGQQVCCMVRPARKERRFPPGVVVNIIAGDVDDPPALRAAMQDVTAIVHLAALRVQEARRTFESVNHQGTRNVIEAAQDAGVKRLIFLSQIGAETNSAYAFFRSKGLAEDAIRASALDYTILRASMLYGEDDDWVTNLAMLIKSVPWVTPIVGDGEMRCQPLWIEDLVTCIARCLDEPSRIGQTLNVGGPECFTLNQIADTLAGLLNVRRRKVHIRVPLAMGIARTMERMMLRPLLTQTMVEGMNVNSITDPIAIPHHFGFEPARFAEAAAYLRGRPWRRVFLRRLIVGV